MSDDDFTTWLTGVLDGQEAVARQAIAWGSTSDWGRFYDRSFLAAVEADRAILKLHLGDSSDSYHGERCDAPCIGGWDWAEGVDYEPWPCQTARFVGSRYRYHPGWREEWAPDA